LLLYLHVTNTFSYFIFNEMDLDL